MSITQPSWLESEPTPDPADPGSALPASDKAQPPERKPITPLLLSYAMGPLALVALIVVRRWNVVAQDPIWVYVIVLALAPILSAPVNAWYFARPSTFTRHLRIAVHSIVVTAVIYSTGWGPVLISAYAIVALENISRCGSKAWRQTLFWNLVGVTAGQVAIWQHWVPSFLSVPQAQSIGLLGSIVLAFIVRMAGATSEEKECAEATVRTSEDRFRSLVQNSFDTTLVLDSSGRITYSSPAVETFLGVAPSQVVGHLATDLVHPEDLAEVDSSLTSLITTSFTAEPLQFRLHHASGEWRYAEAVVADLRGRPSVGGFVVNLRDITERKEAESLLAHQALHDPLTGLPNRLLLVDRLRHAITRGARSEGPAPVVMFLDLDRFKLVNDSLGHSAGDQLLVTVAERLCGVIRASDTLARFGGDEFVILCEDIADTHSAGQFAERVRATMGEPFEVNGELFQLGVSIGVAFVDDEYASAEELLSDADSAMYLAKAHSGEGRIQLFDQATRATARQRVHTESALAHAVERNELMLFYQPIVDVRTGRSTGVEALLRWEHPSRGLLAPSDFLDLAEQTGLIVPIGTWVLSEACRQVRTWNREQRMAEPLALSVNLSGRQLIEPDLVPRMVDTLETAGVDPGALSLSLEVTETLLPTDQEGVKTRLRDLHDLGIQLAIDDFGTGYSSLRYVRELPISIVKIDRSFVSGLGVHAEDEAIVSAVVRLAHTLGLTVVAEGVETPSQFEYLANVGCDHVQGYLFGHPEPAHAFQPSSIAWAS
jgi:diguanylate cyclase (GGDEF)-like protein/PAS domain S-box-containing protein